VKEYLTGLFTCKKRSEHIQNIGTFVLLPVYMLHKCDLKSFTMLTWPLVCPNDKKKEKNTCDVNTK